MSNGSLTVGGYSFYLNVVVIDSSRCSDSGDESSPQKSSNQKPLDSPAGQDPEPVSAPLEPANDELVAAPAPPPNSTEKLKQKMLAESRSLVNSFSLGGSKHREKRGTPDTKKFVQGSQRFMNSLSSSISKSSSNLSRKASAFVASKTMVSRAEKAVGECIPSVTEEIGVEMSISKRFQQGPVFVLEVDMKGCDLLELLEKVLGDESAEHYRNVRKGLDFLGMKTSKEAFDQEILPIVRQGMMQRMSEIVPEKMKLKKSNSDLEIQCVALEDAEEAKWLYNFLEFMEQMKK